MTTFIVLRMKNHEKLSKEQCKSLLKLRAKVLDVSRSWLGKHEFIEVQGPILLPAVGARPKSFRVNYYGQDAFLTGGLQPYSDFFLEMLGKIFTISPTFRAESNESIRHLAEFWTIEVATLGAKFEDVLKIEEEMLAHICSILVRDCTIELTSFSGALDGLERVETPFPKLKYDEAIEKLQRAGFDVFWGEPLDWEMERKLSLMYKQPFFITEFPINTENFFYKSIKENGSTLSCDLLAPEGYGELASGGELITEKREFLDVLKGLRIGAKDKKWYLSLRRFDSIPRSGFALGVERLLQWICKLEDIQEAIAFPRANKKIYC